MSQHIDRVVRALTSRVKQRMPHKLAAFKRHTDDMVFLSDTEHTYSGAVVAIELAEEPDYAFPAATVVLAVVHDETSIQAYIDVQRGYVPETVGIATHLLMNALYDRDATRLPLNSFDTHTLKEELEQLELPCSQTTICDVLEKARRHLPEEYHRSC